MRKRALLELRKMLAITMAAALVVTAGCGKGDANSSGAGDAGQNAGGLKAGTQADTGDGSAEGSGDNNGATDKNSDNNSDSGDNNGTDESGSGDNKDSGNNGDNEDTNDVDPGDVAATEEPKATFTEADLDNPIDCMYKSHPIALMKDTTEYGTGNYYTIELERSVEDKFPELIKILEKFGEDGKKDIEENLTKSAPEIDGIFESGWGLPYEFVHNLYPIRADGRVFSFVVENYTFLAGAHGYADYTNYNYDPVTGKEIAFSDVVKNTDDLPEIIATEIEKQNDDLQEYFKDCPGDRENLVNGIPDRLKDNARALAWTLGFDGIQINFEDYAMGTYAAGARAVYIKFADYPDVFTDTYDNYKDGEIPDITRIAMELKEAEIETIDAEPYIENADNDSSAEGEEEGYGEDWWYHAVVKNPGWSAWTADGISTNAGEPSIELSEVKTNTTDWLNENEWSKDTGIPLPESFPYSDGTYKYSVVNNAEGGEMSLTVFDESTSTLNGNYYFDEFISPPDQGEGMFADFTEPSIQYALVKDNILYVSLGHRTYASANPHKSYIVAIDTVSGETLWRSDDQVCGSYNFVILGDSIVCGYGFTDEPDYIYILNRNNGKVQKKIKVKSAPYYFIVQEEYLYVLTYNTEYLYKIVD
ncbi:hypothetical protein [Butyrivibrio sp. AD3002]|uniref:hypothetical protein n=1 Tax=Butyrivibrio sp. AD3002 TaxID=1280670 RepID=UPI0003B39CAF|nr:hypothetical protein [Butyrivibrio sp. AD3002]